MCFRISNSIIEITQKINVTVHYQQMQQGRRTSSLKASYKAMTKKTDITKDFSANKESSNQWVANTPSPLPEKTVPKTKK